MLFARAKLEEGRVVFAGMLNPHSPEQMIFSHRIADWLREQSEATDRSCSGN
jgi:hypothetical protein